MCVWGRSRGRASAIGTTVQGIDRLTSCGPVHPSPQRKIASSSSGAVSMSRQSDDEVGMMIRRDGV